MEVVVGLVAGAVVVGLAAWLIQEFRWRQKNAELRGQLQSQQSAADLIQAAKAELNTAFQATAGQALQSNTSQFLELAEQNLGKTIETAKGEFEKRQQSFQELVKPLSENYSKLNPTIESLMKQNLEIMSETRGLRDALTDNAQVGLWGQSRLRRIIELAGMVQYSDFSEQESADEGDGRPDVTVRLPEQRAIVIDAKASTAAYLEAQETEDEEQATAVLIRHAGALRSQVDDLAKKDYGSKVSGSLPFVVMFVPGDQFLAAALRERNDLVEYAMRKRIAIATPSSLIALLWAVENGWRQHHLAQNAEEIRKAGEDMHSRLLTFIDRFVTTGQRLDSAVRAYNDAVGSFDGRLIPQARRFAELQGRSQEDFRPPDFLETEVRKSSYGVGEDSPNTEDETP